MRELFVGRKNAKLLEVADVQVEDASTEDVL